MPPLSPLPPSTLLLLHLPPPPPTSPPSLLTNHYQPPILSALASLATPALTIAVYAPFLRPDVDGGRGGGLPRSAHCDRAQRVLTVVYTVVAGGLGKMGRSEGVGEGEVDVRVVFYYDCGSDDDAEGEDRPRGQGAWRLGPVFSIREVLGPREGGRWERVLYATGEGEGGGLEELRVLQGRYTLPLAHEPAPEGEGEGGEGEGEVEGERVQIQEGQGRRHSVVAVGGTFDHLHAGHKLLLTTTALLLDPPSPDTLPPPKLIIGLTGPHLLLNKAHSSALQPWPARAHATLSFLAGILTLSPSAAITTTSETAPSKSPVPVPVPVLAPPGESAPPQRLLATLSLPGHGAGAAGGGKVEIEIHEINDPFGPTITQEGISALVVSEETRAGGGMVNARRRELGWGELEVFVVGVVEGGEGEGGGKLSSTEIRRRRTGGL